MAAFSLVLENKEGIKLSGFPFTIHFGGGNTEPVFRGQTNKEGMRKNIRIRNDLVDGNLTLVVYHPKTNRKIHTSRPRKVAAIPRPWTIAVNFPLKGEPSTRPTTPERPRPRPDPNANDSGENIPEQEGIRTGINLETALRNKFGNQIGVTSTTRKVLSEDVKRRLEIRQNGKELGRKVLGSKPRKKFGQTGRFIPANQNPQEMLEKTRSDGLKDLKRTEPKRRGMIVYEEDVKDLSGQLPPEQIEEMFNRGFQNKGRGSVIDEILRRCIARKQAKLQAKKTEEETSLADSNNNTPVPEPSIEDEGTASLISRLDSLLTGEASPLSERPTIQDLRENLTDPIPSGPADADAIYDYHALQVAWSDAWSAVIDGAMESKIQDLYDSIVEIVDPEDIPADLSEIDELNDLLATLEEVVHVATVSSNSTSVLPSEYSSWVPELVGIWDYLSDAEQEYVRVQKIAETFINSPATATLPNYFLDDILKIPDTPEGYLPHMSIAELLSKPNFFKNRVLGMVAMGEARKAAEEADRQEGYDTRAASQLGRAERLIGELKNALVEPYQFDVFAEGAYNFGVLATYRQKWHPQGYQAGDLAGAIALAPNEKRSYSLTRTSSSKNTRSSEREQSIGGARESAQTSRAEADITDTVKRNTAASVNSSASGSLFGVVEVSAGAEFGSSQDQSSNRVKKELRELTRKSSQEYRDGNKVSVTFEESHETSFTESREIQNPNNELTVTYLFYELQRKYEVAERLHDMTPVILVAYDMPTPNEITEAWLLKHDWIIRKSLLDDSYLPSLQYLSQTFAGDEVSVEILELQWKTQLAVVSDLRRQGLAHQRLRDQAREAIEEAVSAVAETGAGEEFYRGGIGRSFGERLYSAEGVLAEGDAENARQSLDWTVQDLERIESSAREAVTALERATNAYVTAVEKRLNRRVQIDRLILHVKENILHYMQAIWDREHPDQRYLRLYDMDIQWPGLDGATLESVPFNTKSTKRFALPNTIQKADRRLGQFGTLKLPAPEFKETRKLHQVADLRKPMGFRGNLAIFPLIEQNALSLYMAQDFLDAHFGIMDPDPDGEIPTASEAVDIARCAWGDPELDEAGKAEITEWLMNTLQAAHRVSQEIVVPTGELFIEALPGKNPILEDFKLQHRAHDTAEAGIQVKMSEVELIRRAMRLQAGDTSDPDTDKHIRIDGAGIDDLNVNTDG